MKPGINSGIKLTIKSRFKSGIKSGIQPRSESTIRFGINIFKMPIIQERCQFQGVREHRLRAIPALDKASILAYTDVIIEREDNMEESIMAQHRRRYESATIRNIRQGRGNVLYAQLIDADGELMIAGTMDAILGVLRMRLPRSE